MVDASHIGFGAVLSELLLEANNNDYIMDNNLYFDSHIKAKCT